MSKVGVDGERFADAEFFHDDETETVDEAICLVLMFLEVVERRSFFVRRGPMDTGEFFRVELLTQCRGLVVPDLQRERNRLGDDVIRRQEMIAETQAFKALEGIDDASMVGISLRDECEQKARIEERHTLGRPCR